MITMTEIARLTGVSQPTVSRVLNGNPNVGQEIRERVLACAKEHNYQCNALAKGLQGSKTMLLGVLVTDISNGFFADLAKAIEPDIPSSSSTATVTWRRSGPLWTWSAATGWTACWWCR